VFSSHNASGVAVVLGAEPDLKARGPGTIFTWGPL